MQRRELLFTASCLTALGLLLSSCAAPPPAPALSKAQTPSENPTARAKAGAPTPTPKPADEQPKYGGILTIGQAADPVSFDVHQETAGQHAVALTPAYNGLVQHDPLSWPQTKLIADLANSWDISADGLEYTFHLQNGAKWHDGRPFTSEDVKASLDRIFKPPRGIRSPRQASFQSIAQVEAVAPDVVRIRLQHPSASLFTNLAIDWLVVLPKHVLESKGDMKRDIVGTGPFRFSKYASGVSYEYVKNGDYFVKGRPYLDGIKIYPIKDDATRFAAFRTGRVLVVPPTPGVSGSQASLVKTDPSLAVQSGWRSSLWQFRFNLKRSPWADPRIRRAVSLVIDRQAFIAVALESAGLLGARMPSQGRWGIPEDELLKMPGYRQPKDPDVAEAKKLMAEAGFPQGFKTSILTRPEEAYQKRATFLAAELAKLGIKADLDIKPTAAEDDALIRGAFDTLSHGLAPAIDDPDLVFGDFYITSAGRNYGKYSNPKTDELHERQARALDVDLRKKLVRELLTILEQDNPDVALAWAISLIAHNSRVRNYRIAPSFSVNNRHQEIWLAD
ncbi:MAG: ABC transporter substrate-binding protein [Chloroflexi bacterium]|nr:ABC transporter substrate-binding protein [Chloroflexota bacterium]